MRQRLRKKYMLTYWFFRPLWRYRKSCECRKASSYCPPLNHPRHPHNLQLPQKWWKQAFRLSACHLIKYILQKHFIQQIKRALPNHFWFAKKSIDFSRLCLLLRSVFFFSCQIPSGNIRGFSVAGSFRLCHGCQHFFGNFVPARFTAEVSGGFVDHVFRHP